MSDKKSVLILSTTNSARSQMAEGLLRHIAGDDFDVASAGVTPLPIPPEVIQVMQELRIDLTHQREKSVEQFRSQSFDYVITVCDNFRNQCPFGRGARHIPWTFVDPASAEGDAEKRLVVFRKVRDEILQRLRLFIAVAGPRFNRASPFI